MIICYEYTKPVITPFITSLSFPQQADDVVANRERGIFVGLVIYWRESSRRDELAI